MMMTMTLAEAMQANRATSEPMTDDDLFPSPFSSPWWDASKREQNKLNLVKKQWATNIKDI